jgi:ABC-2 type transport system ATP-binding protein
MGQTVLEIRNLTKQIQTNTVLHHINLEVEEGKIYGIIGRNGSGKSMLFKTIAGLLLPTEGDVCVLGEIIGRTARFPKEFGALIEHPGFLPQYSGFRNLKILASIRKEINDEDIRDAIRSVGLDPEDKRPVRKYSLGMKQRLGIAQAIMEKPKLLVLDEPMNGLDREGVKQVRQLLKSLRDQGMAILLASHNPEDIEQLCDYVYEMHAGSLEPWEALR